MFSCQDKSSADKTILPEKYGWETVKINVDNKKVVVPFNQDTCYFSEKFADTTYAKSHNGLFRIETAKFTLSKAQRDTLFKLVEDAIKNHAETSQTVSDYAGQYVTLTLEQYNSSISCKYSSITNWTSVSPTLSKISSMTFDQVKQDK